MRNINEYINEGFFQTIEGDDPTFKLLNMGFEQISEFEGKPCFYMSLDHPSEIKCNRARREIAKNYKIEYPEIYLLPTSSTSFIRCYTVLIKDRSREADFIIRFTKYIYSKLSDIRDILIYPIFPPKEFIKRINKKIDLSNWEKLEQILKNNIDFNKVQGRLPVYVTPELKNILDSVLKIDLTDFYEKHN